VRSTADQHDLGISRQQLDPGQLVARSIERRLNGSGCGLGPALSQAEQGQARLRLPPGGVSLAVGALGLRQLPPQPVQLPQLVVRHPQGRVRWITQPLSGPLDFGRRLDPVAAKL